jgi:CcmD family protein
MTPDTFPALFQGYTVVWVLLVVYVVSLGARLKRLESRLQRLSDKSGERAGEEGAGN